MCTTSLPLHKQHFCRNKPNKGEVNSKASVLPTTLQTNPNAVGDRHPLRIVSSALETFLKVNHQKNEMSLTGDYRGVVKVVSQRRP